MIIEGLDSDVFSKIELNKSVDQSTEEYKIEYVNKLIKNLNITEEKADELFKIMHDEDFDYYADAPRIFTYYSKSLTDKRGYLDKSRLDVLDISEDFKFLVKNLDLCGSDILSFGKTFYDDEFYIIFKLNSYNCYRCYEKEDFYFDENGVFRLKDGVFLIKFIDLLSFKGTYLKLEPYFEFLNVILHDDSSYEFRIGDDRANFMSIRSRDILVKVLKEGTRADMYAKRFL